MSFSLMGCFSHYAPLAFEPVTNHSLRNYQKKCHGCHCLFLTMTSLHFQSLQITEGAVILDSVSVRAPTRTS